MGFLTLRAEGLWKSYGGKAVLKGVSYEFAPKKTYALMGPNGAGKSTLLRLLSLIESPERGRVEYINAEGPVREDISLKRRITLLLPEPGLFNRSALANVRYGLKLRGIKGAEGKEKALIALSAVGLSHKARQNALTLSSGEAQRLAIARAVSIEPEFFFLDEPTASLDEENRRGIEEVIQGMRGLRGVILCTHDREQAFRLADTVLFLKDGLLAGREGNLL
jgi:tungstate transport system ATP-binding protein